MSDGQPQPAAGGQQPQQLLRADDILRLQCLTEDERQKYRQVMMNFWNMTQQHAQGTSEHTTARQKLLEYSQKFIARERQHRKMKSMQGNQGQSSQGSQATPQNAGQVKQEQPQAVQRAAEGVGAPPQPQAQQQQPASGMQQPQAAPGMAAAQPRPAAPNAPAQQVDAGIIKHVQAFAIQVPVNGPTPGTPEYDAKVKEFRNLYLNMLARQATCVQRRREVQTQIEQRQKAGQEVAPDMMTMRLRIEKEHGNVTEQVDKFRKQQVQWRAERDQKQGQPGQGQPGPQDQFQPPAQSHPQQQQQLHQQQQQQQLQRQPSMPNMPAQPPPKEEPQIKVEGGQIPQPQPGAQFNMQGNQQQQPPQNLQMPPSLQQQQQQARAPPGPHSQARPAIPATGPPAASATKPTTDQPSPSKRAPTPTEQLASPTVCQLECTWPSSPALPPRGSQRS
jgi:hypothetical protein